MIKLLKMNHKKIVILLIGWMAAVVAGAQPALPNMTVGNQSFYYYQLEDKESVHGVAQKLGVSIDDIYRYNPWAKQGLVKKQLLLFPTKAMLKPAESVAAASGNKSRNYTMGYGEDIYTVAKKFGTNVESILGNNLKLSPEKYVEGAKIKVVPQADVMSNYEENLAQMIYHNMKSGETFATIAAQYNITPSDLQKLNPSVKKPKKGKNLIVPQYSATQKVGNIATIDIDELRQYYNTRINDIYRKLVDEQRKKTCNVAVVLPFQLHKEDAPKQAHLYTDFLKGFMVAMDSLGYTASRKINVKVYDTKHNLNVTDSLLALPVMSEMNFIIAPNEPKQLERINKFAIDNGITVLNCFSTKADDFKDNANVLMTHTPTPSMVATLCQWMQQRFNDCTFIYLEDAGNQGTDMFTLIKENVSQNGMHAMTLQVGSELTFDAVSNRLNPGTHYVFVPTTSSKALLKKILPALKQVKSERFDCDINLLGYPEYVLYLKDSQPDLMAVDTYMFSRFFNAKGFRTRNVEASYAKWYGGTMLESYPHMGLLGFDTGAYLLKTLGNGIAIDENTEVYKGIQTGFKFGSADGISGLINQAITLVHFSPDKKIESFVVTDK